MEIVKHSKSRPLFIAVVGILSLAATAASAQEAANIEPSTQLDEIVVTAQKRAASLQDVPLSITAMAGEKMAEAGIKDLADMSAYVPNFQKSETSMGQYLVIRGISSGINQGFEQSVVQYVDDIAMSRSALARMPFLDLERIEVLRGPQNVLFGKNSIGGALSLVTAKPTATFTGQVGLEYEPEYNAQTGTLVLSGPFSDSVRGRIAARYYQEDGYFYNNLNGHDEAGRKETAIRGTLTWDVTDNVDATLKYEHDTFDYKGRSDEMVFAYRNPVQTDPFYGLTYPQIAAALTGLTGQDIGSDDGQQDFRRNTNINEYSNNKVDNATLQVNWDLGFATLTSVTGWASYKVDERPDADAAGIDAFTLVADEKYDQFSQELRFVSPGNQTVDWIAGAYYQDWKLDYLQHFLTDGQNLWSALGALGAATGNQSLAAFGYLTNVDATTLYTSDSTSWAVFGQATWNATDRLHLTVGGRYTEEDKSAHRIKDIVNSQTGTFDYVQAVVGNAVFGTDFKTLGEVDPRYAIHDLRGNHKEKSFAPTFIAEYELADEIRSYASVARGFKAGGFTASGAKAQDFDYKDETVTSYELGLKSRLFDGAAELNAAVFYTDYKDLQVSQFDGSLSFIVGNAAAATTQGIELEGRWLVTDGLTLSGSLGYLDFEFNKYDGGACTAIHTVLTGEKTCSYAGQPNIYTPKWAASLSLDYVLALTQAMNLRTTVDVNYRDKQYVDVTLNPDLEQDAYTKINARLALETGSWVLALVGQNLTDEKVMSFVTDTPLSGTLKAPAYTGYMERPRTIAVQASYRF